MTTEQLMERVKQLEGELAIAYSRLETESEQRVNTYKHDLARVLRVDYADYQISAGKEMTVELGEAYRGLVAGMFDVLQNRGVNVKG